MLLAWSVIFPIESFLDVCIFDLFRSNLLVLHMCLWLPQKTDVTWLNLVCIQPSSAYPICCTKGVLSEVESVPGFVLGQGSANFIYKGPDHKYFRLFLQAMQSLLHLFRPAFGRVKVTINNT